MPCQIKWHLCFVFGLIGGGLALLGTGWLYNANLGRSTAARVDVHEMKISGQDKDIDEIKADLKELLRRVPPNRISMVEDRG